MNARIQQLMDRSFTDHQGERFDPERFAQLLVAECADFANDHNSEVEGVTLGVGRALKQHFGIES
jgi:NTP pyrophosphatase (non-canonical NTP hydrolase)